MNVRPILLTISLILSVVACYPASDGAPVSVRPVKFEFAADESIEIIVTNVSADPIYLIPTFSSYPYDYFYPPDNYLERFDGEYWRPLQRVRDIAYYDKKLLFFKLETGETHTLTCSLSDFTGPESENGSGEYRAAVTVIADPEAPVVAWKDFEEYGRECRETVRSDAFKITAVMENDVK
jgi:hypothetical protein